jgi:hypothetical protein
LALPRNRSAPRNDNLFITFVSAITSIFILVGITLLGPIIGYGQSQGGTVLSQESRRDPFLLPSGVRLLSKSDAASGTKGILSKADGKRNDISSSPLKVKAILISDHVRLALIDRHIVTVGDTIHDEKILEIKADRVILGKGDQKRTLLLSQSAVLLTVEERIPHGLTSPQKERAKEGGKGELR